ncbi:hypothetical protein LJC01_03180 [Clostridiaceae bacterium OttesenSCG-928-D20]|nr:hypothetical protein [Clostridiaceae bacterium OttesenSCG-928-D20]
MSKYLDLIFLCIIIVCIWTGYKKGIIMGIGGLLIIAVALFGGRLVATSFSYEVLPVMRPFANGYIERQVNKEEDGVMAQLGEKESGYSLTDLIIQKPELERQVASLTFASFGLSEDVISALCDETLALTAETGEDIISAMTEVLCRRISYVAIYVLSFLLILIALTVIGNLPNLSFKMPGGEIPNLVNDIAGAVIGLIMGLIFCALIAWALKYTGVIIKAEVIEETWLVSKFFKRDYFGSIITY